MLAPPKKDVLEIVQAFKWYKLELLPNWYKLALIKM